jgi:hypothetical protein
MLVAWSSELRKPDVVVVITFRLSVEPMRHRPALLSRNGRKMAPPGPCLFELTGEREEHRLLAEATDRLHADG